MKIWRMAMKAGGHGVDMWPRCRDANVAAITYEGIATVDLAGYSMQNKPPEWKQLAGSQRGSVHNFAWEIRGGDAIYVRDSASQEMVGFGYVRAPIGELAYRFDESSPVEEPNSGIRWHHLIDVAWDPDFIAFQYLDRSPNTTVLKLRPAQIEELQQQSSTAKYQHHELTEQECERALLIESAYLRSSPSSVLLIERKHARLSNDFRLWLRENHDIDCRQEQALVDVTFRWRGHSVLTEFKVAYEANTRHAIREALGQILEYNHYPQRQPHDEWLLILDTEPSDDDRDFIRVIRDRYSLPITLGWKNQDGFDFSPSWLR